MWPGQVHCGVGVQGGQELHEGLNVAGVDQIVLYFCAGVVRIVVILVQWDYSSQNSSHPGTEGL